MLVYILIILVYIYINNIAKKIPLQKMPLWNFTHKDPLEKGMATHSDLENSMDCIVHGVAKSWTQLINFDFHTHTHYTNY